MGFVELVAFLAITMALNALAIDVVLPGLPALGADLGVHEDNRRQLVIVAYLIGMGASQLVHGPLADRIGRRPTLLAGLAIYSVAGLASALAPSFGVLIAARVVQGLGAGAPRVVAISIARDRYRGPEMARVMSLVMMVFMVVPILAPTVGQGILLIAPWRWIFGVLAVAGIAVGAWTMARLGETLAPEHRRPLSARMVARGFVEVARTRATLVPTIAMTFTGGALMAFVTSAQQIFQDTFGAGKGFTLLFALIAVTMSVGSFANSKMVQVIGPARLARRALHVQMSAAATLVALALTGHLSLPVFEALQAVVMLCFGFTGSNLNAIAMEPMGHLAGTASSVIGAVTTIGGALIGGAVGGLYDGTARPLVIGTLVLGASARLVLMLSPKA
ncbi:MAG: multidrug effflux MFS transporter [Deltaproteobacteria bacterium]|nr:multidrug effflux MFS transporter [Deltaproteobacteria bacterium]